MTSDSPPPSATERFRRLETIFHQASEKNGEARRAYLDEACGKDAELRQEVLQMLGFDEQAEQVVDGAVFSGMEAWSTPETPERIGPYRILELLGQGGLGAVYSAERDDEHFRKRVAVKCVRPELASPMLERRLRAERQILAGLDHPYIARILDGGIHRGASYIVMELVEGDPLPQYCRKHRLGVTQKVELFRKICDAVHYAHQSLILHCDLKPSNILIDPQGLPKLLDFGIAKALQGSSAAEAIGAVTQTAHGFRALTPEYASPEQARQRALTTGTDIYSLGILLYELLAGRRPYQINSDNLFDVAEVIAQTEAPTLRSSYEAEPEESSTRRRRRAPWGPDLDAVVAKAIRKEPEQRYRSAEQLSEDLLRYLENRPVAARQGTWLYTWSKLVRRHRLAMGAAAAVIVTLVSATVITAHQAAVARHERERAEHSSVLANAESAQSKALVELLVGVFENSEPDRAQGEEITARELLDRGAARLSAQQIQPPLRADLATTIGRIYRELAVTDQAEIHLLDSLQIRRRELEPGSPKIVDSLLQLAELRLRQDRVDEAEELLHQAMEQESRVRGTSSPVYGLLLRTLARCRLEQDRTREARDLLFLSLDAGVESDAGGGGELGADRAEAWDLLAQIAYSEGDYEEAEDFSLQGLDGRRRALGPRHPEVAVSLNNVAAIRQAKGDLEGARELMEESMVLRRQIFGEAHDAVALGLQNLAVIQMRQGDLEQAEKRLEQALDVLQEIYGPEHRAVADVLQSQALLHSRRGRRGEAVSLQRRALDIRRLRLKPGHPDTIQALVNLGDYFEARDPGAEAAYREAVTIGRRYAADHPNPDYLAYPLERLGRVVCARSPAEAVEYLEQAWNLRREAPASDPVATAMSLARLGRCGLRLDRSRAFSQLRRAADDLEAHLGADHRAVTTVRGWLEQAAETSRSEGS